MLEVFNRLRYSKKEYIYVLKNGEVIYRVSGSVNQVKIDTSILLGNVELTIIHNHPEGSTFSDTDIFNMIDYKITKMYLVTEAYIYLIETPETGWPFDKSMLDNLVTSAQEWANEEISKELQKETINFNYASLEKSHYIWTIIFQIYNVKYSRKKFEDFIRQDNF